MSASQRNIFRFEQQFDETGQKLANVWTLILTDWMAHQFQQKVFPCHGIDYLRGRIEKLDDGRTLYEFELDESTTQHFWQVLNAVYFKQQVN